MNYNSVEEIFNAGTTNMTVVRNNSKQDDGTDTITGVNWFTFNNIVASKIYVSGNSWLGFGATTEHLKVNRRDGALYSLYREEGTLYNHFKFLKIRWKGYSAYNYTSSSYALTYDVILWDTGDISLHMISIPTSYANGTYTLNASSTYSYTVNSSSPDVTFIKTDSGFNRQYNIIVLERPPEIRYLIRSGASYYTISNNALTEVNIAELTSSAFLTYGVKDMPDISLWKTLANPEILYWTEVETELKNGLVIKGTPPLPQIAYYDAQNISGDLTIEKVEVKASDDVVFAISFDDGQTWKYYNNAWIVATAETDGMTAATMKGITSDVWSEIITSTSFSFRGVLPSLNSFIGDIYIRI